MATLVFSAVGRLIGGNVGRAVGAVIGQRIDQKLFGGKGRQGPRLNDLSIQDSSYGTPIPKLFGANRVAGTVIWSTDLIEAKKKVSQGKGQPKATVYSYAASFAVALSARPIVRVGRIWADGKLLRGAAGDFKTQTGFRLYTGGEGQGVDPLIASLEGASNTPAYRGIAYAVFDAMQLADYGNRIPSLSFEVIADEGAVAVGTILSGLGDGAIDADVPATVNGFAAYGDSVRSVAETLESAFAFSAVDDGCALKVRAASPTASPVTRRMLGASADAGRVPPVAIARRSASTIPETLSVSHYEIDRDYQQGVQRARRDGGARREVRVEAPFVLAAPEAKAVAELQLGRLWNERVEARVRMPWSRLDLLPGDSVAVEGSDETWRIRSLQLENMVLEAGLVRSAPQQSLAPAADAGRALAEPDLLHGPTTFHLLDLPPLGDGLLDAPQLAVAAAGVSLGWRSAALLMSVDGGANWIEAGATALPATMGTAVTALGGSDPRLIDRARSVDVALLHSGMVLSDADEPGIRAGRNLAMLGNELIQFRTARPLGGNVWRLSGIGRGLRATEWAVPLHAVGERFVLIDNDSLVFVTASAGVADVRVLAAGLGDGAVPPEQAVSAPAQAIVPPAPVHLRAERASNGDTTLSWVRRSRDGWRWLDAADAPLGEEIESYAVTLAPDVGVATLLDLSAPSMTYTASQRAAHQSGGATSMTLIVRQRGRYGLSRPASLSFPLT